MDLCKLLKRLKKPFERKEKNPKKEEANKVIKAQEESLIQHVYEYCSSVLKHIDKIKDQILANDVDSKSAKLVSAFNIASYNYYVHNIYDENDMKNLQQAFDDFQKDLPQKIKDAMGKDKISVADSSKDEK